MTNLTEEYLISGSPLLGVETQKTNPYVNDPAVQRQLAQANGQGEATFTVVDQYKTKDGVRIRILPVSQFILLDLLEAFEMPKVPTYVTQTASGKREEWDLTEEIANDPRTTPYDKQRWLRYVATSQDVNLRRNMATMRVQLQLGTELLDPLPKGWDRALKAMGRPIPEDEDERKLVYLLHGLQGDETIHISNLITARSTISEEEIKAKEAAF